MKSQPFDKIFLLKLVTSNQKGFTLIELLITVVIIGIMALISLPNLIGNVSKARETEATNNLGTISRSQQAYHLENQTFANTLVKLDSSVNLSSNYYSFPNPATATDILVQHQAVPTDVNNQYVIKNYASGIYFEPSSSNFQIVVCQAQTFNVAVDAPNTASGNCTNGGKKIN
jgi:type IV pilus assembly protein PilA